MIIYNEFINLINKIDDYYINIAKSNNNLIEVKVNRSDPLVCTEYLMMEYRPEWNDFVLKID